MRRMSHNVLHLLQIKHYRGVSISHIVYIVVLMRMSGSALMCYNIVNRQT